MPLLTACRRRCFGGVQLLLRSSAGWGGFWAGAAILRYLLLPPSWTWCSDSFPNSPVWLHGSAAAWTTHLVPPCLQMEHGVSPGWLSSGSWVFQRKVNVHSGERGVQQGGQGHLSAVLSLQRRHAWLILQVLIYGLCTLDRCQHVDVAFMFYKSSTIWIS